MGLIRFLTLLALGCWIGSVAFFSFVVAPSVFRVLAPAEAGGVVGAMFPRYYAVGLVAAALALLGLLALGRATRRPAWRVAASAAAVGLGATAWAGGVVPPRAQRLRVEAQTAGRAPGDDADFRAAHREAVALNGAALLAALAALAATSAGLRE
jgi:hypothetical protein